MSIAVSEAVEPVLVSPHSLFKMDEGTGVTLNDSAPAPLQIIGDMTYAGTNTAGDAQWTGSPGCLTPVGWDAWNADAGGHSNLKTLETLGGQLIFFCDYIFATLPTGTTNFFDMGEWGTTNTINTYFTAAGTDYIKASWLQGTGSPFTSDVQQFVESIATGAALVRTTRQSVLSYFDPARGEFGLYINGQLQKDDQAAGSPAANGASNRRYDRSLLIDLPSANGFKFMRAWGGGAAGGSIHTRRMGLIVTQSDKIEVIPSLAHCLSRSDSHTLPSIFNGV